MSQRTFFNSLPKVIPEYALPRFISRADLAALRLVDKSNAVLFRRPFFLAKFIWLLTSVKNGDYQNVLKLLARTPFLLEMMVCSDTALGLATRLKDIRMINIITECLAKSPQGEEIKVKQVASAFGDRGFPEPVPFAGIELIAERIAHCEGYEKDYPPELINNFRTEFDEVIKHEFHFNPLHLVEAFQVYHAYEDAKKWNITQSGFFFTHVIGYIQTKLPCCHQRNIYGQLIIFDPRNPNYSPGIGTAMVGYKASSYYSGSYWTKLHLAEELLPYVEELLIIMRGIHDYAQNSDVKLSM